MRSSRLALRLALLLVASEASSYPLYTTGTQVRGNAFTWHYSGLGSNGAPWSNTVVDESEVRSAVLASFRDLTAGGPKDKAALACSTLVLTEAAVTADGGTSARVNDRDGINAQGVFVSSPSDPLYAYMRGGVVAFASPMPDAFGYVRDCDTAYNAVDMHFVNDGSSGGVDLQAVAQQETAHCFGLHHVCRQSGAENLPRCSAGADTSSVMFPFAGAGAAPQHPNARDQDNLCQLYPVQGVGRPCDKPSVNGLRDPRESGRGWDCQAPHRRGRRPFQRRGGGGLGARPWSLLRGAGGDRELVDGLGRGSRSP